MKEYQSEVNVTMDVFKKQLQLVADIFRRMAVDERIKAIEFAKEFMKEMLREVQQVLEQIQQNANVDCQRKVVHLANKTPDSEHVQDSHLQQWGIASVAEKVARLSDDKETLDGDTCEQQIRREHGSNFAYDQFQLESCTGANYHYLLPACEKIHPAQDAVTDTVRKCVSLENSSSCDPHIINNQLILNVGPQIEHISKNADVNLESPMKEIPPTHLNNIVELGSNDETHLADANKQFNIGDNVKIPESGSVATDEDSVINLHLQVPTCFKVIVEEHKPTLITDTSSLMSERAPAKQQNVLCKLTSRLPATTSGRTIRHLGRKRSSIKQSTTPRTNTEGECKIKRKKSGVPSLDQDEIQNNSARKQVSDRVNTERSSILTRASARALTKKKICSDVTDNHNDSHTDDCTIKSKDEMFIENCATTDPSSKTVRRHHNCSECGQSFSHGKSFKAHIISHGVSELSCRRCRKQFVNIIEFRSHACKTSLRLYCDQCHINFNHPQHFKKHMSGHNRNNCKICNAQFAKRKALCHHLRIAHKIVEAEKFYHCPHCDRKFIKRPSLYVHLKDHAEGKIVCMKCGFMCETKEHFTKHTLKHTEEAKFHCEKCNENFLRRQQYEQHMTGHDKYDCTLCDISFSTKKHLMKHKRLVHGIQTHEEKKHICNVCDKKFQRPMLLRIHTRIHTGERPIQCTHCDKNFRTPKALAKHTKTTAHLKASGQTDTEPIEVDKPFLCAQCGAKFYRRRGLVRHMQQLHSDNCPYSCPYCEYSCKCKTNLKRHIELHTTERRYVCEMCGASFHARATLKEHHAYVHSESRNFVCSECGKSFKGRSGLRRHLRIHSDARPYICYCGQAYKRMSHLKRHMIALHGALFKSKRVTRIVNDSSQSSNSLPALSSNDTENYQESETMTLQVSDGFLVLPNKDSHSDNNSLTITVQHDVVELLQNISVEQIESPRSDIDLSQPQTSNAQDYLQMSSRSDLILSASREVIQQTLNIECPTHFPLMTDTQKSSMPQLVSENVLPIELDKTLSVHLSRTDGHLLPSLPSNLFHSNTECSVRLQPVPVYSSDEQPLSQQCEGQQLQNAYSKLATPQIIQDKAFCISSFSSSSETQQNFPVSTCASASTYSVTTRPSSSNKCHSSDSESGCQELYPVVKSKCNSSLSDQASSQIQSELTPSATCTSTCSSEESAFSSDSQKVFSISSSDPI